MQPGCADSILELMTNEQAVFLLEHDSGFAGMFQNTAGAPANQ